VQRVVVQRRADDGRERDRGEGGLITQEWRRGAGLLEHVTRHLVKLLERDAGRGVSSHLRQRRCHHPAGGAHSLDFARRLDLDHVPSCALALLP